MRPAAEAEATAAAATEAKAEEAAVRKVAEEKEEERRRRLEEEEEKAAVALRLKKEREEAVKKAVESERQLWEVERARAILREKQARAQEEAERLTAEKEEMERARAWELYRRQHRQQQAQEWKRYQEGLQAKRRRVERGLGLAGEEKGGREGRVEGWDQERLRQRQGEQVMQQEEEEEEGSERVRGWGVDVLSDEEEVEEGRKEGEEGGGLRYPIQPQSASIPFMITRDMRRELIEEMNYSRKEVDAMKPEYALDLIQRGIKKAPKPRRVAPYPPPDFVPVLDRGEKDGGGKGEMEENGEVIEVRSSSSP
eukprot:evm.model.NODE_44083_length_9951_cov_18.320570.3